MTNTQLLTASTMARIAAEIDKINAYRSSFDNVHNRDRVVPDEATLHIDIDTTMQKGRS